MLRIRFHGRGGHGIKTASRILGTAAFLSGWQAQDSPVYGAERRGAAIAAYTRIDRDPICERGVVSEPDLILVGDATLLADPQAATLTGADGASLFFVNSSSNGPTLARQHGIRCPVLTLDLTALSSELMGRASALSVPLGAVACALAGWIAEDVMLQAVREELAPLHLARPLMDKNLALAQNVFSAIPAAQLSPRPVRAASSATRAVTHVAGAAGIPIVFAHGNSLHRHTGSWRIFRPVVDFAACTRCMICFARCPDAAIRPDKDSYPIIDYDNCKGCMICYQECPIHCIQQQREVRAW